jgi:hypothetical protein
MPTSPTALAPRSLPLLDAAEIIAAARKNESELPVTVARYWLTLNLRERPAQHRRTDDDAATHIVAVLQEVVDSDPLVDLRYEAIDFDVHVRSREQQGNGRTAYTVEVVMDEIDPHLTDCEYIDDLANALRKALHGSPFKLLAREPAAMTVLSRELLATVPANEAQPTDA